MNYLEQEFYCRLGAAVIKTAIIAFFAGIAADHGILWLLHHVSVK